MKIGIIDADLMDNGTRHPNLALMKIAGYYKEKGIYVKLIFLSYEEVENYDEIYISKVFSFTKVPEWVLKLENVHIGGTGFYSDGGKDLPYEIEHHMPDYSLYNEYVEYEIKKGRKRNYFSDYLDYSIGFTTRGCFRKCSFCVNKKYDKVHKHSPVEEFLDKSRPYIYLWDDNILAFSEWKEILNDLKNTGKQFQFRQGIDLRLMTDEKAKVLNSVSYKGDFIFAFDHVEDEKIISEKVQLWKRYSSKVCKMYVLSGYDSQDEKDIESVLKRISVLMKYGSLPYIMRHESYKNSKYKGMYIELARWCNQPQFFKKKSFREFCIANQEYKKNKSTNCAAYQAMLDFESEFPQIAEKYFDLKFENENIYEKQYGYGRKYANKPECNYCKKKKMDWEYLVSNKKNEELIEAYFTKEIDVNCLQYKNSCCEIDSLDIARYVINVIKNTAVDKIIDIIRKSKNREEVTVENIPQYSKFKDSNVNLVNILYNMKDKDVDFEEIGYYLERDDRADKKSSLALKKYGENHTKLACLLDLVHISKSGIKSKLKLTKIGEVFYELSDEDKINIAIKLCLRIPIVQNRFVEDKKIDTINRDLKILSKKTQERRRSNVHNMVRSIIGISNNLLMNDFKYMEYEVID